MDSARRRELRNPLSTSTRYLARLYNVEELNEKDVHEPIIISGMADMKSQDN